MRASAVYYASTNGAKCVFGRVLPAKPDPSTWTCNIRTLCCGREYCSARL